VEAELERLLSQILHPGKGVIPNLPLSARCWRLMSAAQAVFTSRHHPVALFLSRREAWQLMRFRRGNSGCARCAQPKAHSSVIPELFPLSTSANATRIKAPESLVKTEIILRCIHSGCHKIPPRSARFRQAALLAAIRLRRCRSYSAPLRSFCHATRSHEASRSAAWVSYQRIDWEGLAPIRADAAGSPHSACHLFHPDG
jgi:hypothetical protein